MKAKDREHAIRRLLGVQEQAHRLAEWKVAAAQREAAALDERKVALMAFLDGDAGLSAMLADAALKQLKTIGNAREAARQREEAARADVTAEAQRVGRAKRLHEDAKTDADREAERRALAETIDLLARRDSASLP